MIIVRPSHLFLSMLNPNIGHLHLRRLGKAHGHPPTAAYVISSGRMALTTAAWYEPGTSLSSLDIYPCSWLKTLRLQRSTKRGDASLPQHPVRQPLLCNAGKGPLSLPATGTDAHNIPRMGGGCIDIRQRCLI